jgi:uncharacterized membrane protein
LATPTIIFGILLGVVGVAGYFGTGMVSVTALIPAFMGLPFLLLGALAYQDRLRKHVMHLAAALALVGFLVTASMGWPKLVTLATGGHVERPAAVYSQSITALLCGIFVVLCVNSFIQARRRQATRRALEQSTP